jgi:hypothetical protein
MGETMSSTRSLSLTLILLLVFPLLALAGERDPWQAKLPFENAVITYAHSGMEEGAETLYIRKYGEETARYLKTTTNMMGITTIDETVAIETPEYIYQFDLQEKTGTKIVNPKVYFKQEFEKLPPEEQQQVKKNSKGEGMAFLAGMGGEIEENALTILGYSCDRIQMAGTTSCNISRSGIALKTETDMMGIKALVEAVELKEGAAADKYFEFPAGIEPIADLEADAISQQMAKQTMNVLKNPNAFKARRNELPVEPSYAIPAAEEGVGDGAEQQEMEEAIKMLKELFGK